ncbi:MAG: hypothetical protein QM731_14400 [Chitinophagaceae bacterium]
MKQTTINTMKVTGIATLLLCTFFACKKDETKTPTAEDQATTLELAASAGGSAAIYDDVFDVVMQEGENGSIAGAREEACATVTITPKDTVSFPKTMVVDFGAGCVSSNGITRKGKFTATISGKLHKTGTTVTVTFDGYYVNGYKVEGTYSITNNSTANGSSFTTSTTGGKITSPLGSYYNYSGTHTLTQTAGAGTLSFEDDVFSLTGSSKSSTSAGKSLDVTITSPLVKKMSCKNIVSGVQSFTYLQFISGTLDYGDGTCDNKAVLKIGSSSTEITLPR